MKYVAAQLGQADPAGISPPVSEWEQRGNCLGQFQFHRHVVEGIYSDLVMWSGRGAGALLCDDARAAAGVNALAELDRVLAGLNRFRGRLSAATGHCGDPGQSVCAAAT